MVGIRETEERFQPKPLPTLPMNLVDVDDNGELPRQAFDMIVPLPGHLQPSPPATTAKSESELSFSISSASSTDLSVRNGRSVLCS